MAEAAEFQKSRTAKTRPPFTRMGKKYADDFLNGGPMNGTDWLSQALSSESRYGGSESIERPYSECGWVHVALKAIGAAVRQLPLCFYETDPREDPEAKKVDEGHPLYKLFRRPNRLMNMSRFLEAGVLHRKLDGEDFWFMFNKAKHPVECKEDPDGVMRFDYPAFIMPVRGRSVKLKCDQFGFPAIWKYPTRSNGIDFPYGSVVQFSDYDPDDPLRGMGDVEALLRDLALEFGAQRYLESMLYHSGDPGGLITTSEPMSEDEEERAAKEASEKFSLKNAGKWHVVSGEDLKYVPNKFGPKDMQFQEMLKWVRDKSGSLLGVPLPVMGILDDATFSNYGEAVRQFWQHGNGVLSYTHSVEETINDDFLPRLRDPYGRSLVARFDTSMVEALQDDMVAKVELALKITQARIGVCWKEACGIAGLPSNHSSVEYGEECFMDPNTTTAEAIVKYAEEKAKNDAAGTSPKPNPDSGEEDDFPGSDDFDSGSNGPTGSDGKSADEDESRRDYFKGYESDVLQPSEERMRKMASSFLWKYQRAQLKAIRDFAEGKADRSAAVEKNLVSPQDIAHDEALMANLLLSYVEWVKKLAEEAGVPLEEALRAASEGFAPEIDADVIPSSDPWAADFLRKNRIRLSEGVNSTLSDMVRRTMAKVFEDRPFEMATMQEHVRQALPELTSELKRVFKGRTQRASTIARTEVNRAANATRFEMMRREGIEEHQWVTSGDAYVRNKEPHSHVALDGAIRTVGDSFREGRPLSHPGDPAGDPEDTINCRCVTRPIVQD